MQTLILSCSHRKYSNSRQIADQVISKIKTNHQPSTVELFDLGENPIPLWEEAIWNGDEKWSKKLQPLQNSASQCDSLIIVVPEYAGMASPAAKNIMLMLDSATVGHKPALLIGVSASVGGTYPIAEMRMSSVKNNRIVWIPDHLIIRSANDFKPPFQDERTKQVEQRLNHSLKVLNLYSEALKTVRQSQTIQKEPFPFGM